MFSYAYVYLARFYLSKQQVKFGVMIVDRLQQLSAVSNQIVFKIMIEKEVKTMRVGGNNKVSSMA